MKKDPGPGPYICIERGPTFVNPAPHLEAASVPEGAVCSVLYLQPTCQVSLPSSLPLSWWSGLFEN